MEKPILPLGLGHKKILIIGQWGMLGQDLLKVFPHAAGVDRDELDITSEEQVEKALKNIQTELVINAAAYNDVDACESDEGFAAAQKINAEAAERLAKNCLKHSAALVHYSTNYVFDGQAKDGYTESDQPRPVNRYGASKLAGEQAVLELQKQGLRGYVIRTSKLFGQPGGAATAKQSFFSRMRALAEKQSELKIVDDELSNFTYTPDLARATYELLANGYEPGIYHIVNEHPATWYEGAQALFKLLDKNIHLAPVTSAEFPRPAARPKYGILLNTKFPKLRNYEEALQDYIKTNPKSKAQ